MNPLENRDLKAVQDYIDDPDRVVNRIKVQHNREVVVGLLKEINILRETINKQNKVISGKIKEQNSLNSRENALIGELEDLNGRFHELYLAFENNSSELEELQMQNLGLKEEKEDFIRQINRNKTENSELLSKYNEVEFEAQQLQKTLLITVNAKEALEQKIIILEKSCKELHDEKEYLKTEFENTKIENTSTQKNLKNANKEISRLQNEKNNLQESLSSTNKTVQLQKTKLDDLDKTVTALQAQNEALKKEKLTQSGEIQNLKKLMNILEDEKKDISQTSIQTKSLIENELKGFKSKYEALESKVTTLEKDNQNLKSTIDKLETNILKIREERLKKAEIKSLIVPEKGKELSYAEKTAKLIELNELAKPSQAELAKTEKKLTEVQKAAEQKNVNFNPQDLDHNLYMINSYISSQGCKLVINEDQKELSDCFMHLIVSQEAFQEVYTVNFPKIPGKPNQNMAQTEEFVSCVSNSLGVKKEFINILGRDEQKKEFIFTVKGAGKTVGAVEKDKMTKDLLQFFDQKATIQANPILEYLHIDPKTLNPKFNKEFTDTSTWKIMRPKSGFPYYQPIGCKGIALMINETLYPEPHWLHGNDNQIDWCTAYHGPMINISNDDQAAGNGIKSIIDNGFRKGPRAAYGPGVYCSPYVEVAECYAYTFTFSGKFYRLIFQCRVLFSGVEVPKRESLIGCPSRKDDYFVVKNSYHIRPYRILIKEVKSKNEKYIHNAQTCLFCNHENNQKRIEAQKAAKEAADKAARDLAEKLAIERSESSVRLDSDISVTSKRDKLDDMEQQSRFKNCFKQNSKKVPGYY